MKHMNARLIRVVLFWNVLKKVVMGFATCYRCTFQEMVCDAIQNKGRGD